MEHADVVIIGAGLAGVSAAWHLTGRRSVLVVEQADQPCAEASAQNAGMVRRLVAGAHERELACRSHSALGALNHHPDWRELQPFRATGALIGLAEDSGPLPCAAADLGRRGVPIEDVPNRELGRLAPALAGAPLARAFFLPDEGTCDAWSLGQGFVAGARARGARFELGTRVTAIRTDGSRILGVATDRGQIDAEVVLLAAGAWSQALAATAGLTRSLVPRARHLLQSAPHPLSNRDHPWCWIDDVGFYVRPEAGTFLCSPCDEVDRYPTDQVGSAGAVDPLGKALALDKLERFVPALADLRFAGGWTGLRTFTPDRQPLCGFDPELEGLFWLAGLGGFGVTCAFALGEDVANLLVDAGDARQNVSHSR